VSIDGAKDIAADVFALVILFFFEQMKIFVEGLDVQKPDGKMGNLKAAFRGLASLFFENIFLKLLLGDKLGTAPVKPYKLLHGIKICPHRFLSKPSKLHILEKTLLESIVGRRESCHRRLGCF